MRWNVYFKHENPKWNSNWFNDNHDKRNYYDIYYRYIQYIYVIVSHRLYHYRIIFFYLDFIYVQWIKIFFVYDTYFCSVRSFLPYLFSEEKVIQLCLKSFYCLQIGYISIEFKKKEDHEIKVDEKKELPLHLSHHYINFNFAWICLMRINYLVPILLPNILLSNSLYNRIKSFA